MNASELLLTAKKIAESHISSGMDLNDAITKTASEHNLSKDQIERLVEETNKVTFLELLEKKGEQEFPVADYNVVKSKLTPKIEKTASEKLKFESLVYSETEFRKQIGESKINTTIEKTANDKSLSPECLVYIEAFTKVAQEVWNDYQTYTDLMSLGQKRYGNRYNESTSLEKIAKEHRDTDVSNIKELEKKIIKQGAVLEVIDGQLEKLAHGIWKNTIVSKTNNPVERAATYSGKGLEKLAVLNLVGKGVSAVINPVLKAPLYVAGGVARVGLKGAAMGGAVALPVVAGVAMRHPGASLNVGFEGAKGVGITKQKLGEKRYVGPGTSVLFFPEGTRSGDGEIQPFKKGAFKFAIDLGIPILPVTINGTRKVLPKGSLDLMPGGATMIIHKPISVKGYHEENMNELMDKTRMIINTSLD